LIIKEYRMMNIFDELKEFLQNETLHIQCDDEKKKIKSYCLRDVTNRIHNPIIYLIGE
jgi:hypothetical protein